MKKIIIPMVLLVGIISTVLIFVNQNKTIAEEICDILIKNGYDASIEIHDEEENFILSEYTCIQTAIISFDESDISVHLCEDEQTAVDYSSEVDSNTFALVDFFDIPHLYRYENAIVMYVGSDEKILNLLTEFCGKEFYPTQN